MKKLDNPILIIAFFIAFSLSAQEKLKGNKEVTSENRNISEFQKIEIIDDMDIYLTFGETQSVIVETDSNLHEVITTDIKDGVLTIKTDNKISRKKELIIHLKLNKRFKEIFAYNNVNVISKSLLIIDTLTINAFDNSDYILNLNSKIVTVNCKKSSDLKLEILSDQVTITSEESSKLKGSINTNNLTAHLLDKADINISGAASEMEIETIGNSEFKGNDFKVKKAIVKSMNSSDIHVNASETVDVYAINSSEVYIYANPKIQLIEFFDKASLYKRETDKRLF